MFIRIIMLWMFVQLPSVNVVEKPVYEVLLKEGHQLIDVRTPVEFMEGHIDGAKNINVKSIEFLDQINFRFERGYVVDLLPIGTKKR